MKLALNLAAVLLMAVAATPASAQRGGGLGDGGRVGGSLRGTVDTGRVASREAIRTEGGDAHHARRRFNAANDSGTRIRRADNHQARRRWNAANGDADARADVSASASAERRSPRPERNTDNR